jgi:hypothetical protein
MLAPLYSYFGCSDDRRPTKSFEILHDNRYHGVSPDESFCKIIKERGWGIKEDQRWRDRYWAEYFRKYGYGGFPDDLFLHEESIPESERLKYSKHIRWGPLPGLIAAEGT